MGKAISRWPTTAGNRPSTVMPIVNTTSSFAALTPVANQARPATIINTPVRLPGRRHQANMPVPRNDQPTSSPSPAVRPRSSVWSLLSTSARYSAPRPSAAAPSRSRARGETDEEPSMGELSRRAQRRVLGPDVLLDLLKGAGFWCLLEHEPVMVEQLALEADAVGAHAGGEREPEIGAREPARQQPELEQGLP